MNFLYNGGVVTLEEIRNHPSSPATLKVALAAFETRLEQDPLRAMNEAEVLTQAVRDEALKMLKEDACGANGKK